MKVAVIGLGSMGKRRIRLIQKYNENIEILGIDTRLERREACATEYDIEAYESLSALGEAHKVDGAFICTAPLSHQALIHQCLELGMHVFTELNLVADGYAENIALAKQKELVLFQSSTFLYRDEIKTIKSSVQAVDGALNYTYHVGQYLPDWHPWESYHDFFVANKRTNGCREIFAIELPWLTDVFGEIVHINVVKNKISTLNVDYADNYFVMLQHKSGHKGMLAVDIVSRKAVRNLEVFGEQLYMAWNGSPEGLRLYDYEQKLEVPIELHEAVERLDNYSSFVVENAYYNEIAAFFEQIAHGTAPLYSMEQDEKILKVIDEIENGNDAHV
ncbi:Gfo/Idh/MocA family protein [Virgibacillus sp. MG-45]|uniref:Gfo/Idh/MocA family protein n=1 Tax=Virgibacillus sp. MG-45 TaxID=3102791 RepID=UPI002ED8BDFF